jgi:hypothetical protein
MELEQSGLWRVPPVGPPALLFRLDSTGTRALVKGDRIWAFARDALTQLALDGTVLDRMQVWGATSGSVAGDRVFVAEAGGIAEVVPAANVRHLLRVPGALESIAVTRDGTHVAATVAVDHGTVLAQWQDRVPADPRALPAYLGTLTNARLAPGSDAVTWE